MITLSNPDHRLLVLGMGKLYEVTAIVPDEASANRYMADNPGESVVDEHADSGTILIAKNEEFKR